MHLLRPAVAACLLFVLAAAPADSSRAQDPVPSDAQWQQAWFDLGDGVTTLHADVLRSEQVPWDVPQPVVVTVGPFFGHQGETTQYGETGPSGRFHDFLEVTDLFAEGWTYVMVDLPGFGGSNGCIDWGGDLDRAAVVRAVEWIAQQPWSTGRVGMMGVAWDGWTALMGVAEAPEALAAVVAMEPLYSGYRYQFTNGLRIRHSAYAMPIVNAYDAVPGPYQEPEYTVRGAPTPYCYAENIALGLQDEEVAPYWEERSLLGRLDGSTVPLFLMQGFLESSTNVDGAFEAFNALAGSHNRAWFGQFDTGRGWETTGDTPGTGQDTFVAQMMDFLDFHVKGVPAAEAPLAFAPAVEVQDNLGRYRAEAAWPPGDAVEFATDVKPGSYLDQDAGVESGTWTISPPLPHDVWLAGEPRYELDVTAPPRGNLVANLYDIDEDGRATLVQRGGMLLREAGEQVARFRGYGQDWVFEAGHRIGVVLADGDADWWMNVPTHGTVEVRGGQVHLPFLTRARTDFFPDGEMGPDLATHLATMAIELDAATIQRFETPFVLPGDLGDLSG